jgi:UDP-GlcNAc:undecaprenyl-phosphate/decaprenyl-phosphate GlcNAc-1-phosphate transferase
MTHYAPVVAALVSMMLTLILLYSKTGHAIQDIPNERSLHDTPIPRIGGVGLVAGMLLGWTLMLKSLAWWVVLPMLLLFAVSLVDDARGLPVKQRLLAQLVAAAVLVYGSGLAAQNMVLAGVVLLATIWMTNLFNFMDGSDGLAGGMAFFGFSTYGAASLMSGDITQAMLNFSIGAAALGFLYHNFYPAKVFMGDAGSIPLGFLSAAMGLWGWKLGHWPLWFPLLAFLPFVMDATVTLVKRSLRGARITEAHREHYYQRLVQMGWGHRDVALMGYFLMLASGISAIWAIRFSKSMPWQLLLGWGVVYLGLMLSVDWRWKVYQHKQHGQA